MCRMWTKESESYSVLSDSLQPRIVHGYLQVGMLEWIAFPSSMGSSQPRDQIQVSHISGRFFTSWVIREALVWMQMLNCPLKAAGVPDPESMVSTYVCHSFIAWSEFVHISFTWIWQFRHVSCLSHMPPKVHYQTFSKKACSFLCMCVWVCAWCVLSHFRNVWLSVTAWNVTHQAPLSMGFSRQEYWSGLPCPPPDKILETIVMVK